MNGDDLIKWRLTEVEKKIKEHDKAIYGIEKLITKAMTAVVLLTVAGQFILPILLKKMGWM